MLIYTDTVTSQDGWVYNNKNYFRYSIFIGRIIPVDSRYDEKFISVQFSSVKFSSGSTGAVYWPGLYTY